jgi:hypothetical protein
MLVEQRTIASPAGCTTIFTTVVGVVGRVVKIVVQSLVVR